MTVRSQWVVFWAGYMYVSVKKQYPEMSYINFKTYKFFCLFGLWPNAFFVKVVLWKDSKSYLYWFMNVFVTDSWHQTWCLPLLWHLMGSFPLLCGHWVWVACLAWHLFPSTAELWHFFLFFLSCVMVGYSHSALDTCNPKCLHYWSSCLHDSVLTFALKEYVGGKQRDLCSQSFPLISPDS